MIIVHKPYKRSIARSWESRTNGYTDNRENMSPPCSTSRNECFCVFGWITLEQIQILLRITRADLEPRTSGIVIKTFWAVWKNDLCDILSSSTRGKGTTSEVITPLMRLFDDLRGVPEPFTARLLPLQLFGSTSMCVCVGGWRGGSNHIVWMFHGPEICFNALWSIHSKKLAMEWKQWRTSWLSYSRMSLDLQFITLNWLLSQIGYNPARSVLYIMISAYHRSF